MEKADYLNWLQGQYRQWEDLLDQIDPARMEQLGLNGIWSMKDMVAHLNEWNRDLVDRLQAAQRGEPTPPPPWPAEITDQDEINAWIYEHHRERSLQDVLEDTEQVFQRLFDVIKNLPDDVQIETLIYSGRTFYLVWIGDERFPAGEFFYHWHDDHEPDIRAWMAREGQR